MLEELSTNKLVFLDQSLLLYLLLMETPALPWIGVEILQLAAAFAHLGSRTRSVLHSSARDVTGCFFSSLLKISCTVSLEITMTSVVERYIQACFSPWHCYIFWLWQHIYLARQRA